MVYKKYIKSGGKTFGPYLYKSRKENGKVITEYLGPAEQEKSKVNFFERHTNTNHKNLFLILGLVGFFILLFFLNSALTGKVSLQIDSNYQPGEKITGNLKMSLKQGELIPANTKVIIDNSGEISEYLLSDLISEQQVNGSFYSEGSSISGEGNGYGLIGEKKIYPVLNFELKIKKTIEEIQPVQESVNESSETEQPQEQTENETQETEPQTSEESPQPKTQTPQQETSKEEKKEEKKQEKIEEKSTPQPESSSSSSESSILSASITGEAISENKIIGQVSKDNPFTYSILEGETVEIQKNSVEINGEKIDENNLNLQIQDNTAIVTTEYYYTESGFGKEYLTNDKKVINIDLTQLGLVAQDGKFVVRLVYGDTELVSSNEQINVEEPIEVVNKTIEKNVTEIIELNITQEINETEILNVIENITTLQYKAIIGRPVKWIKTVKSNKNDNLTIGLPKKAVNITIKTEEEVTDALNEINRYEEVISDVDKISLITGQITGEVSLDIEREKGLFYRLWKMITSFSMTGNAISEDEFSESISEGIDSRDINVGEILTKANISGEVDVGVEYYTDAPVAVESPLGDDSSKDTQGGHENLQAGDTAVPSGEPENWRGKRITISADDEFDYEDILAYTLIEKNISMNDVSKIRMYWYATDEEIADMQAKEAEENNVVEPTVEKEIVEFVNNRSDEYSSVLSGNVVEGEVEINESVVDVEQNVTEVVEENAETNVSEAPQEGVPSIEGNNITINPDSQIEINESEDVESSVPEIITKNITSNETGLTRVRIKFNAYDLDKDGYVDYVEWIVPHLSEQVYEIIYIEKAVHLDENKEFVSDIYDDVKELDGNWSEVINNSHYVRVTFEQELDNTKDITIYARAVNNESSSIEVYAGCDSYVMINGIKVPYDVYLKKKRIEEIRGVVGK